MSQYWKNIFLRDVIAINMSTQIIEAQYRWLCSSDIVARYEHDPLFGDPSTFIGFCTLVFIPEAFGPGFPRTFKHENKIWKGLVFNDHPSVAKCLSSPVVPFLVRFRL